MKYIFWLCLVPAFLSFSSHAKAQNSSAPLTIFCSQIENYGAMTSGSINHPKEVILNLSVGSSDQYVYTGFVKNWRDGGGGQSANASYDPATGKIINNTPGVVCPPSL